MSKDFVAGCLGGISGRLVSHPLDTIKCRLQTDTRMKYTGAWNCFVNILRTESVHGLYKGMLTPLLLQAPTMSLQFGVYGNTLRLLGRSDCQAVIVAGVVSGAVYSFIEAPVELIKIRLQNQGQGISRSLMKQTLVKDTNYRYANPIDCVIKIHRHEQGIFPLYRGLLATMLREVPFSGLYFGSYHYFCLLLDVTDGDHFNLSKLLLAGGMAGSIATILTYPVDVVKSRYQMDGMGQLKYKGLFDCARKSYIEGGWCVFFRGIGVTVFRTFPMDAACLTTATWFLHHQTWTLNS